MYIPALKNFRNIFFTSENNHLFSINATFIWENMIYLQHGIDLSIMDNFEKFRMHYVDRLKSFTADERDCILLVIKEKYDGLGYWCRETVREGM